MHTLYALVLTAAAAVVLAHPPVPNPSTSDDDPAHHTPIRKYQNDFIIPKYIWSSYFTPNKNSDPNQKKQDDINLPATKWLTEEIERLTRLRGRANLFETIAPRDMVPDPSNPNAKPFDIRDYVQPISKKTWTGWNIESVESEQENNQEVNEEDYPVNLERSKDQEKKEFALTPNDEGYFEHTETEKPSGDTALNGLHEGGGSKRAMQPEQLPSRPELEPEPPRETRQNPNLGRTKTLVAENLDKLRIGLSHDENDPLETLRHMTDDDANGNFYGVALISGIGAITVLAVLGFAVGWYTLSKRAKAAADVDYPAYGVTGPTIDTSGDRKLAHSAHMYHYQHQKQQIIAMERSGMEQRSGSVTDPESDEENEEGDYTVYECPGFATTGDMEVKNPLFNEEPTPATPANCELVKPQPKE